MTNGKRLPSKQNQTTESGTLALVAALVLLMIGCQPHPHVYRGEVTGNTYYASTRIPVSGVTVAIDSFSYTTGSDGLYELGNVPTGQRVLRATKTNYDPYGQTITVSVGTTTRDIDMTSDICTYSVRGTITNALNESLAGVRVAVLNPDSSESDLFTYSSSTGYYQIPLVPQGNRTIVFTISGYDTLRASIFIANCDYQYDARLWGLVQKVTLSLSQDAFTDESLPDANFGGSDCLWMGTKVGRVRDIYVQVDVSSIPANSKVDSAWLWMWLAVPASNPPSQGYYWGLNASSWTEGGITYNHGPGGGGGEGGLNGSGPSWWKQVEVTDFVSKWVSGEWPNYGIFFDYEAMAGDKCAFSSREAELSYRPYVRVCFRN